MKKIHHYDSILSPVVTEKATILSEKNKVVFKVNMNADKKSIKKNIEKIFKVNVTKINTITMKGKRKIVKGKSVKKKAFKKAIITLQKGQSIDMTTGL